MRNVLLNSNGSGFNIIVDKINKNNQQYIYKKMKKKSI